MISLSLVLLFHERDFFFALKGNLSALCTRFRFHTNNTERLNGYVLGEQIYPHYVRH